MMKRYLTSTIIGTGVLLVAGLLYAQAPFNKKLPERDGATQRLVNLAHDLYQELAMPDAGTRCRLGFSIETVSRGPHDSLMKASSEISYDGSASQIVMESSQISFYQDSTLGLSVIPARKEVQLMPSSSKGMDQNRRQLLMQGFYHELFDQSQNVTSREVEEGEYELVIVPDETFQLNYGVEQLAIRVQPEQRRLRSIHMDYREGGLYESITMTYNSMECSDTEVIEENSSDLSVRDRVFMPDGRIRPEYHDYTIVDLRNEIAEQ